MTFSLRDPEFVRTLNVATKYPSIPTYHKIRERGRLTEEHNLEFVGEVVGTEKIDGCNTRIIIPPMGWDGTEYLIGSREELLHAQGDLIINPASQVVETVKPWLDLGAGSTSTLSRIADLEDELQVAHDALLVLYVESYGAKAHTAAWKHYTVSGKPSFRLFDIAIIPIDILSRSQAWIASWRDNHQQVWLDEAELAKAAFDLGLPLAPRLFTVPAASWPTTISDVYDFMLAQFPDGRTHLDVEDGVDGVPEGLVIRTPSANKIAKIRFADYKRTLGIA